MITLASIDKRFNIGQSHEVFALRHIDLHISDGEWVTIIGTNGAGKSTLLQLIAGACRPDAGTITIAGHDVTGLPEIKRARFIGRVFQNPLDGTAGTLTVEQNLVLAMARTTRPTLRWGITGQKQKLFHGLLAELGMGLENRMQAPVHLLSGGQRQALTLLMATIVRPTILLLDEHTAALDPSAANQIETLTARAVSKDQLTVLMVTHNMDQALRCGTRTIMLHQGKVILDIRSPNRDQMTIKDLIAAFKTLGQPSLLTDEILLNGRSL
ncbi:MAG: ABC transporter ATP-binding protein [Herpetosiphon sp.]